MSELRFEIPATFEMTVYLTNGDSIGKVGIDLPMGKFPTHEKIMEMVEKAKKSVEEIEFGLCTPHEFGREVLLEKTGQRIAVPGPNVWEEESFNVKENGEVEIKLPGDAVGK